MFKRINDGGDGDRRFLGGMAIFVVIILGMVGLGVGVGKSSADAATLRRIKACAKMPIEQMKLVADCVGEKQYR